MKKAVAYMRYSSENQDDCSIEHQRLKIEEYCERNNIALAGEYVDKAITGKTADRPGLNKLMNDIKKPRCWDTILVFDWSRFFRNAGYAILYSQDIRDHGFELISISQPSTDSPMGKMMEYFFHICNEYYSDNNALHTHAGLSNKAKQALHCGGIPPLGYNIDANQQLVINEKEAEAVKIIFDMFEQGNTYQKIADYLNNNGYTKKNGEPFNKNSFRGILEQEKYTGTFVWNRVAQKKSNGKRNGNVLRDESEHIRVEGGCPQIISKEQFERVQAMKNIKQGKHQRHYMLGNLDVLKCAECGSNMQGNVQNSHGRKYSIYFCPNHKRRVCSMKEIGAENLEKLVGMTIGKILYNHPECDKILQSTDKGRELKKLKAQLQGKGKAINNVLHTMESGVTNDLKKKLKKLNEAKESIQAKIDEYNVQLDKKTICKKLIDTLIKSEAPEVRQFLKNIIDTIEIDHDSVKIVLND